MASRARMGIAIVTSSVALMFSGYSFYETVLKRPELRIYQPPLIHMYREAFRDVFAIPVTLSNDAHSVGRSCLSIWRLPSPRRERP